MESDAERIRDNHDSGEVYFCTSRPMDEKKKAEARKKNRKILGGGFAADVLAQADLANLATRYEGPLEAIYGSEINALRKQVAELLAQSGGTAQLQIAHAISSEEGFGNRDRVAEVLAVEMIARTPGSVNEVAVRLQALLRIPTAFPRYVVEAALLRLEKGRLVQRIDDDRFQLTEAGRGAWSARAKHAAEEERNHQARFATEVTKRLGFALGEKQLDALWVELMRQMSTLLARSGARFIGLIEAARQDGDLSRVQTMTGDSVMAACRVAASGLENPTVREETEEALYETLLTDPTIALEWLEGVLAAWLAACQLGLIPEVSQQLRPALTKIALGLDTDVMLSLLCEGEPDNHAVVELLTQWNAAGGRTYIAPEVLKEVAHHAWIARVEFEELATVIQKHRYDPGLARKVARNAFVRSYWASGRKGPASDFERYIKTFAGERADDTREVQQTLGRLKIGQPIGSPSLVDLSRFQHIEARVRGVLARLARFAPHDPAGNAIEQDKLNRDAAAIVRYAAVAHSSPTIDSLLLLSSSKRLRVAVRRGADDRRVVVALASTLGLLLAAASTRQLQPQSVAQLMLAEGARGQVSSMRRELVRMLARSDLLGALPQARIVTLEREVEAGIREYARTASRSSQQIRRDVVSATDREASLKILGDALRKSALGAEVDRLVRSQAEEIERLKGNKPGRRSD